MASGGVLDDDEDGDASLALAADSSVVSAGLFPSQFTFLYTVVVVHTW